MSRKLSEPIIDNPSGGGNFFSNFFNGRVLTADALNADQLAHRQQRRLLGRAVGDGVVEGLEVKIINAGGVGVQAVISITKGLALNRSGQVLQLHSDEQVALVRKFDAPPPVAGTFADCVQVGTTFDTLENGAYLLVIGPASGYRERVPMRGLSDTAGVNECGSRYRVEGVQFRLARFDPAAMTVLSAATRAQLSALMSSPAAADLSKLRNLLAHVCLGTEELAAVAREPLKLAQGQSVYASYGVADFLRGRGELNDCEVPLALLLWRGDTLRFADMWAVRRRVAQHQTTEYWPPLATARRAAEGEAVFLQFQEHLESIRGEADPEQTIARNFFVFLPPVGIVPVRRGAQKGFESGTFFNGVTRRRSAFLEGARLDPLLREALTYPPVDLSQREMVWVYEVRQNKQAANASPAVQPVLVFAGAHVPYQSLPRFDAARWDFSNYASCDECVI
jgi:hypothetical protein